MNAPRVEQDTSSAPSRAAGSALASLPVFDRIFSRHLMNLALLMLVPMLLAPTLNLTRSFLVDPDIWWHLADARYLFTTHHFIHTDPYAFSAVGQHWIDWEWLGELPYWFSYQSFGLRGIYLITWLALSANLLFVYWRGFWISRHAGAALWAAGVGFFLMTVNAGPRTIAFAYLAMSAELAILEAEARGKKRLVWLLPPLFCLWINLHGTWFIGMCLLALYIVCGLFRCRLGAFEQEALASRDRNRLLAVFGLSALALLLNPYGWRLMWNPLDMMLNQNVSVASISEWQPLAFSSLEGKAALAAIALMIAANFIRPRKWTLFELAIVLLAWYAAFSHHRFTYMAAILTTPLLARDIQRSFCIESGAKTIPAMNALMVAVAVALMVYLFPAEAPLQHTLGKLFPLRTIASVQPSWRTFNWDYLGGRMDFEGKPTFIDSRYDSFEHIGVLQQYLGIMSMHDSLEQLAKLRIDHALLKEGMSLSYLLLHTPGWQVQAREKAWDGSDYLLFVKSQ